MSEQPVAVALPASSPSGPRGPIAARPVAVRTNWCWRGGAVHTPAARRPSIHLLAIAGMITLDRLLVGRLGLDALAMSRSRSRGTLECA
jgi:hypothetical protein